MSRHLPSARCLRPSRLPLSRLDCLGRPRRVGESRMGASLVVALVCLVVVMAVVGALLKTLLRQRQVGRDEERRRQSAYFAEAAWRRAEIRCRREPQYGGETWQVTLDDHGVPRDGSARIEVVRDAASAADCLVRVTAQWPVDTESPVRRTVERRVPLPLPKP